MMQKYTGPIFLTKRGSVTQDHINQARLLLGKIGYLYSVNSWKAYTSTITLESDGTQIIVKIINGLHYAEIYAPEVPIELDLIRGKGLVIVYHQPRIASGNADVQYSIFKYAEEEWRQVDSGLFSVDMNNIAETYFLNPPHAGPYFAGGGLKITCGIYSSPRFNQLPINSQFSMSNVGLPPGICKNGKIIATAPWNICGATVFENTLIVFKYEAASTDATSLTYAYTSLDAINWTIVNFDFEENKTPPIRLSCTPIQFNSVGDFGVLDHCGSSTDPMEDVYLVGMGITSFGATSLINIIKEKDGEINLSISTLDYTVKGPRINSFQPLYSFYDVTDSLSFLSKKELEEEAKQNQEEAPVYVIDDLNNLDSNIQLWFEDNCPEPNLRWYKSFPFPISNREGLYKEECQCIGEPGPECYESMTYIFNTTRITGGCILAGNPEYLAAMVRSINYEGLWDSWDDPGTWQLVESKKIRTLYIGGRAASIPDPYESIPIMDGNVYEETWRTTPNSLILDLDPILQNVIGHIWGIPKIYEDFCIGEMFNYDYSGHEILAKSSDKDIEALQKFIISNDRQIAFVSTYDQE